MTDRINIPKLARLELEATAGPWDNVDPWWGSVDGGFAAIGPVCHQKRREPDEPGTSHYRQAKRDQAFVNASRNALPALLRLAQIARKRRQAEIDDLNADDDAAIASAGVRWIKATQELDAALDSFDWGEGE